ncbi:hypothetical protein ACFCXR_28875 [Streptomyces noursei]|uniref:hypothetical protein n=1 Tax=Streptomyces noursei TaxID=1971 RepID=UPI0035E182A0
MQPGALQLDVQSLDCFPLIGPCSVAGLLLGAGIAVRDRDLPRRLPLLPVIARHLADHVLTPGPPGRRLAWFTPERAPVETMTVAQSITETAAHAAETAHEHGLVLPFFLDDAPVTAYVEQQAGRLYGQLEHPVALPPEILFLAFVLAARDTGHPLPARQLADYRRAAHAYTRRPRPRDAAGVAGSRVARGLRPGGGGTLRLAPDSLAGLRPPPRPTEPLTATSLIPAERDVVDVGAGANQSATTTFSLANGASSSIGRRTKRFTVSRAPFRGC